MDPNSNTPASPAEKSEALLFIALAMILVIVGIVYWHLHRIEQAVTPTPSAAPVAVPGTANQPTQDLGSTLYNKASNPVSGKLPTTVAPVPNPIKSLYKNPF